MHIDEIVKSDPLVRDQQKRLTEARAERDKALAKFRVIEGDASSVMAWARLRAQRQVYVSLDAETRAVVRRQGVPTPAQHRVLLGVGFRHDGGSSYDGGHPPGWASLDCPSEGYCAKWEQEMAQPPVSPVQSDAAEQSAAGCPHPAFTATVGVGRVTDDQTGRVVSYMAEVDVQCAVCGEPFTFQGVPPGFSTTHPTVRVDGQQLRVPILPASAKLAPLDRLGDEMDAREGGEQ